MWYRDRKVPENPAAPTFHCCVPTLCCVVPGSGGMKNTPGSYVLSLMPHCAIVQARCRPTACSSCLQLRQESRGGRSPDARL